SYSHDMTFISIGLPRNHMRLLRSPLAGYPRQISTTAGIMPSFNRFFQKSFASRYSSVFVPSKIWLKYFFFRLNVSIFGALSDTHWHSINRLQISHQYPHSGLLRLIWDIDGYPR